MVFTNKHFYSLSLASLFFSGLALANPYNGLDTQDQNPLLIPYWIPQTISATHQQGVQFSSSLFITNTLHKQSYNNESLIIDAETYRLDLNFQYENDDWVFHLNLPFISTTGGFLDNVIIDFHDLFGMPQGQRLNQPIDIVQFEYIKNGTTHINTLEHYDGIGDLSISSTYPLFTNNKHLLTLGFGLSIPSGEDNQLLSNKKIDQSVWLSYFSQNSPFFVTLGLIKHGKAGLLKDTLNSHSYFAQTGIEMNYSDEYSFQIQFDYHSAFSQSQTKVLGDSLQIQIGVQLKEIEDKNVYLFFSEDISVGSAPDITFGAQIDWNVN